MRSGLASVALLLALPVALVGAGLVSEGGGLASSPQSEEVIAAARPAAAVVRTGAHERRSGERPRDRGGDRNRKIPSAAQLQDARRFAASRSGLVSFATVNSDGKLRGLDGTRLYASASVVKAMLLAAELDRLSAQPIDSGTDGLLRAMITRSDNDAADAIYGRVGDAGLFEVAHQAGMDYFTVAGHWGNAQIAAGDMALMFSRLGRLFRGRHREYGLGLLGSIVPEQSWGIPAAASDEWAVRFKGGWLPDHALVHQAAELNEVDGGRKLSIAVLTDSQPSFAYGIATVRGIAERLLD